MEAVSLSDNSTHIGEDLFSIIEANVVYEVLAKRRMIRTLTSFLHFVRVRALISRDVPIVQYQHRTINWTIIVYRSR